MNRAVFQKRTRSRQDAATGIVAARLCLAATSVAMLCPAGFAQRPAPVIKPAARRQPVPVFRLDAADAAPTRAELQTRMMKSFTVSGRPLTPKSSGVFEFKTISQDTLNALMTSEQKKAAEEKAKQKAEEKKKKAAEKKQAEEDAKIQAAVNKALAEDEAKDNAAQAAANAAKFNISLTVQQASDPKGNAYLDFISPKAFKTSENQAVFQNQGAYETVINALPFPITQYTPNSFLNVSMQAKAGKTYLITAKVQWFGFMQNPAENDVIVAMTEGGYNYVFDGGGKSDTIDYNSSGKTFVVKCYKDGWYSFIIGGKKNEWTFNSLTIKEITL